MSAIGAALAYKSGTAARDSDTADAEIANRARTPRQISVLKVVSDLGRAISLSPVGALPPHDLQVERAVVTLTICVPVVSIFAHSRRIKLGADND